MLDVKMFLFQEPVAICSKPHIFSFFFSLFFRSLINENISLTPVLLARVCGLSSHTGLR